MIERFNETKVSKKDNFIYICRQKSKRIMSKQEVILCESLETSLRRAIEQCPHDKLFILTDEHTRSLCLPSLKETSLLKEAVEICIGAEDVHKTLDTLASVWMALSTQGATRHSLLINLGGGMVTDLGLSAVKQESTSTD